MQRCKETGRNDRSAGLHGPEVTALGIDNVNGHRGSTAPAAAGTWGAAGPEIAAIQTNVDGIAAQFNSTLLKLRDSLYTNLATYRGTQKTYLATLQTLAKEIVIEMVHADATLPSKTLLLAMTELIRQMVATADDVDASTVTGTSAAGSLNVGDGVCAVGVKNVYGKTLEYAFNETIDVDCTNDSQLGATEDAEPFTATGDAAETDTLSYLWPAGSACSQSLTAKDAGGSSNLLTNGDFDTFTVANTPDSWTIQVGAAGTDIFAAGSADDYEGNNALKFTGATLSQIWQAVTTLKPNTVYCFNCFVKDSGAGLLAGVVSIDLFDGTAVINDDAGTANSATVAFSTTGTTYTAFNGFFITPKTMPTTVRLRVHVSTGLTAAQSMFVDHLCLAAATQLYTGGPYVCVFSGATKFIKKDKFTLTIANNYAGEFQKGFERLFGMRSLGLMLPSDTGGAETVADTLVT